jgi:hypothetical protein
VYALSVYDTVYKDAPKFTSVLSIDQTDLISKERLHVLYGMSKVLHFPFTVNTLSTDKSLGFRCCRCSAGQRHNTERGLEESHSS